MEDLRSVNMCVAVGLFCQLYLDLSVFFRYFVVVYSYDWGVHFEWWIYVFR